MLGFFLNSNNCYLPIILGRQFPWFMKYKRSLGFALPLYTKGGLYVNSSTVLKVPGSNSNSHHYCTYSSSEIVSDLSILKNCQIYVYFE